MFANTAAKVLNFDYNSTAPLLPSVREYIVEHLSLEGNPSAVHFLGRHARQALEKARSTIASHLGVSSSSVIFTSGATESNTLAILGLATYPVAVSAVEHSSVLAVNPKAHILPVDENGVVLLNGVEDFAKNHEGCGLISVMAANNETGVIQPIEAISEICRKYKVFFHTDASQAIGRIPFDANVADLVSVSAHKMGGLSGIGCLVRKEHVPLNACIRGGGQERSFRSGTHNLMGILSFEKAIEEAYKVDWTSTQNLRLLFEESLLKMMPDAMIPGQKADRLPNTVCVYTPFFKSETLVINLDLKGIAISAGSACSSGKVKRSHVLSAMGIPDHYAERTVRISLPSSVSRADIDYFMDVISEIIVSHQNSTNHSH
jgi:cysteine desulfurase